MSNEPHPDKLWKYRERDRAKKAARLAAGRDIGLIPKIQDPGRRQAAHYDLKSFCENYLPKVFHKAWSQDHLKVIGQLEDTIIRGGLYSYAMPRGTGKTSLAIAASIWALLYGHRRWVCVIGSNEDMSGAIISAITSELSFNDNLAADFPESAGCIASLGGETRRAKGQICRGVTTSLDISRNKIVLPTITAAQWEQRKDSPCSGSILTALGILSGIRGQSHRTPDGEMLRPDYVLIDDPQTRESAYSPAQTRKRLQIMNSDILGLAAAGVKISGVTTCTVIRSDDLADQLLDRTRSPEWRGEKCKLIYKMPENEELWSRYREIRSRDFESGGDGSRATDFYRDHQAEMDAGSEVAWPERFNPDEISALQHVMNLLFRDEQAFYSEYQNSPLADNLGDLNELTAQLIIDKVNGVQRRVVPEEAHVVTAFVDVQKSSLWWMVCGFKQDFSGYVIDYGTWPEQSSLYYELRNLARTIQKSYKSGSLESQIYSAVKDCLESLHVPWSRADGGTQLPDRIMVDAGWGVVSDQVHQAIRSVKAPIFPSYGRYVGPEAVPLTEWKGRKQDIKGLNWRIPVAGLKQIRHVLYDTNWWKTFVCNRLATNMGDSGCLSLFEPNKTKEQHRLLADHVLSEYSERVEGKRVVNLWKLRPDRADNHFFDCLVGCHVAASIQGIKNDSGLREHQVKKSVQPVESVSQPQAASAEVSETPVVKKPRKRANVQYVSW